MNIINYTRLLFAWSTLFQGLKVAGILIIVLLTTSCGGSRKLYRSQETTIDSVLLKETSTAKVVHVPASTATLSIPTVNLRDLPPGAAYTSKKGQAGLKVTADSTTIYVTATCDSLEILCHELERELIRIRGDTKKEVTEVEKNSFLAGVKWCSIGFVLGVLSVIILIITIKRK